MVCNAICWYPTVMCESELPIVLYDIGTFILCMLYIHTGGPAGSSLYLVGAWA